MAGWRPFVAIALVAFIPVWVELAFRNVHLILAALIVLGLRVWPGFLAIGAAIKIAPGLGLVYFLAARRWRDAAIVAGVGVAILAVSVVVSPDAWTAFAAEANRHSGSSASLIPVAYPVRAVAGFVLAAAGGFLLARSQRAAEVLLVVGIVVASPSLYTTALSMLVAIVPLWTSVRPGRAMAEREPEAVL
jgi:hypothetical protein